MSKEKVIGAAKYALMLATIPVLFAWEILVWVCGHLVTADKMLTPHIENFTEWVNR